MVNTHAKSSSETSRALALELAGVFSAGSEDGQREVLGERTSNNSLVAWAAGDSTFLLCA